MSEKEKQMIERICSAVPKMSEFDKGYLLGKADSMEEQNRKEAAGNTMSGMMGGGSNEENSCSVD